jgi:hypothetical protein
MCTGTPGKVVRAEAGSAKRSASKSKFFGRRAPFERARVRFSRVVFFFGFRDMGPRGCRTTSPKTRRKTP